MSLDVKTSIRQGLNVAQRMEEINSFIVVDFITRAKALEEKGKSIINLAVGEPDFPTPEPLIKAAIKALENNQIKYTPSLGGSVLRKELAGWYRTRYGVDIDPNRVAVTSGSTAALVLVMGVILSPGDEVLMADPGYPCNRNIVRAMEGRAVSVPVGPDTSYQLTAELIKKNWTENTVAALVASPSNPTGTVVSDSELRLMHDVVQGFGGSLIVDEIYHGLTFGADAKSALNFTDNVFVINSFSKYFGMTGWRLGWTVAPKPFIPELEKLAQNLYISNSDIAQQAALAAFRPETIAIAEKNRVEYEKQRNYLLPKLREMGFIIPVDPQGAFYIYADCSNFTNDSYQFCMEILETVGVAIAPGADFGEFRAKHHVRFSYPKPIKVLSEGLERLEKFLKS